MSAGPPVARTPELYEHVDRRLRQIVAFNVRAPEPLLEDACQTAWLRFTRRQDQLSPHAMVSWLVTTATREALRLVRQADRELPLELLTGRPAAAHSAGGPESVAQLRGRLTELQALTARQRRLIWLQGLGFSYGEMAAREQASLRTVERQVLRARKRLRAV